MHFTLHQLRLFEAVARHLSYTQAAAELRLTQPAVSMQVKQLEAGIGLPLFEQLGKRIYLTEAGRELHRYSRAITQQLREIEGIFADLKGIRRGRLALSVATAAHCFASRLLAVFCQRYGDIAFSLEVTNRQHLLQQLENNERDLAIMGQPPADLDLVGEAFMDNPLVVIAAPTHPLATGRFIPLSELTQQPFLMRESGSGTRLTIERFFAEHQLKLPVRLELSANEVIKQAVAAGLGLGIVPLHTLALELNAGCLVTLDVEAFPIQRHWYIVHRQGKRLSPVALAFKDFVLREAATVWPGVTPLAKAVN